MESISYNYTDISSAGGSEFEREVARRRTFAIISHPDAGKTTLTEKLLLYARPARSRRARPTSTPPATGWR